MSEAVYFVVERTLCGGEQAVLYYDILPSRYKGERAALQGLVYSLRLDTLPNSRWWLTRSLNALYGALCERRAAGTLPVSKAA